MKKTSKSNKTNKMNKMNKMKRTKKTKKTNKLDNSKKNQKRYCPTKVEIEHISKKLCRLVDKANAREKPYMNWFSAIAWWRFVDRMKNNETVQLLHEKFSWDIAVPSVEQGIKFINTYKAKLGKELYIFLKETIK